MRILYNIFYAMVFCFGTAFATTQALRLNESPGVVFLKQLSQLCSLSPDDVYNAECLDKHPPLKEEVPVPQNMGDPNFRTKNDVYTHVLLKVEEWHTQTYALFLQEQYYRFQNHLPLLYGHPEVGHQFFLQWIAAYYMAHLEPDARPLNVLLRIQHKAMSMIAEKKVFLHPTALQEMSHQLLCPHILAHLRPYDTAYTVCFLGAVILWNRLGHVAKADAGLYKISQLIACRLKSAVFQWDQYLETILPAFVYVYQTLSLYPENVSRTQDYGAAMSVIVLSPSWMINKLILSPGYYQFLECQSQNLQNTYNAHKLQKRRLSLLRTQLGDSAL